MKRLCVIIVSLASPLLELARSDNSGTTCARIGAACQLKQKGIIWLRRAYTLPQPGAMLRRTRACYRATQNMRRGRKAMGRHSHGAFQGTQRACREHHQQSRSPDRTACAYLRAAGRSECHPGKASGCGPGALALRAGINPVYIRRPGSRSAGGKNTRSPETRPAEGHEVERCFQPQCLGCGLPIGRGLRSRNVAILIVFASQFAHFSITKLATIKKAILWNLTCLQRPAIITGKIVIVCFQATRTVVRTIYCINFF